MTMKFTRFLWSGLAILGTVRAYYETVEEAAAIARTLVDLSLDSVATMATILPPDHFPQSDHQPFALQEYYASCHRNGSLTLLFLPIARHSQNILRSPTHAASIAVTSRRPAANTARVALIGNVTVFAGPGAPPGADALRACYLEKHPDARWWLPGDDDAAHLSYWARFDPQSVYFVGGFGDTHYIGPIPLRTYQMAAPSTLSFPLENAAPDALVVQ